ncbi:hypothetical protein [Alicyclobacillus ferrooxydans]|uniref:hypothetical protein n=1 Tax=Alicyclobacillus ferrooxydans TaxID=471514 RepID=UPI000AF59409|nr:hypothetical protein [Alicyclobacillus ferrooxydans]
MVTQRRLAVLKTKRRRIVIDLTPRYWALGVAVGRPNVHVQFGPLGFGFQKKLC